MSMSTERLGEVVNNRLVPHERKVIDLSIAFTYLFRWKVAVRREGGMVRLPCLIFGEL